MIFYFILFGVALLITVFWILCSIKRTDNEYEYYYDENGKYTVEGRYLEEYTTNKKTDIHPYEDYSCRRKLVKKGHFKWDNYLDDEDWPFVIYFVLFLILFFLSIWPVFVHTPFALAQDRTSLQVQFDDLKDRENTLYLTLKGDLGLTVADEGNVYHVVVDKPVDMMLSVNQYNTDVKAFKEKIYMKKYAYESPWLNWFNNNAFTKLDGYNKDATTYRDILGDSLKTFNLTL